jgi:two-component system CheB/CheR fusion protein
VDDQQTGPDLPEASAAEATVVAMGASAGGIGALQTFFDAMPSDTGAAFVVVVHLDPERRSELASILGTRTSMPVITVLDQERIDANHVYVIAPDLRLEIADLDIKAVPFEEPHGRRVPIDQFFRSVAERIGDGFAVVLSGAGSDGSLGVRAVKESGGIILVQEPSEAEYSSMPRNAIATGTVDFVLPVRELAARLAELIHVKRSKLIEPVIKDEHVRRILAHLRVRTGHDFAKYKRSTVLRRIGRRMQVTRAHDLPAYHEMLRDRPEEAQLLLADLLISVTTFFRDPDAFEALRKLAVPQIFANRAVDEPIRVWVCGCATGEEAYSIAMILLEEASRRETRPAVQIFASDLDSRALAVAREGRYPTAIESDVSEDRLRRFFVREGETYRVRQELRDVVLFAHHDLLKDPPFSRVELISCRNVLIYLDRELQEQVIGTFNYSLTPGGLLLLGASEGADTPSGQFRILDRNARIYQAIVSSGSKQRVLPRLLGPVRVREQMARIERATSPSAGAIDAATHRRALEASAPPSIVVDEHHRVIHMSDSVGRYLQPSGGPMTSDVVDLARSELRFELRSALHQVFEQQAAALSLPILVHFDGTPRRVLIHAKGMQAVDQGVTRTALVMFIEGEAIETNSGAHEGKVSDETVRRLTQELELTQLRLRTVREESEATNEELRAANEELQSINEEYRSTSEELETSREELQSINEELQTVNSELKLKLDAISRAHSDLQNLMAATDFGTLFLDAGLRIKRFTERATELFSITSLDEGRPIADFAHQLQYDDLLTDARTVMNDLAPIRRDIKSRSGKWYDVRLRPYRTMEDKIDGVVITFVDVSEGREVEAQLRGAQQELRQLRGG